MLSAVLLKRETRQPTVEYYRGISVVEGLRIGGRGRGDEAVMRAIVQCQGHDSRIFPALSNRWRKQSAHWPQSLCPHSPKRVGGA